MKEKELFDFEAQKCAETEKGICLFDGTEKYWLPKQFVEDNQDGTFTIPMWLAIDKGLV